MIIYFILSFFLTIYSLPLQVTAQLCQDPDRPGQYCLGIHKSDTEPSRGGTGMFVTVYDCNFNHGFCLQRMLDKSRSAQQFSMWAHQRQGRWWKGQSDYKI